MYWHRIRKVPVFLTLPDLSICPSQVPFTQINRVGNDRAILGGIEVVRTATAIASCDPTEREFYIEGTIEDQCARYLVSVGVEFEARGNSRTADVLAGYSFV